MATSQQRRSGPTAGFLGALALINLLGATVQAADPPAALPAPDAATTAPTSDHPAPAGVAAGVAPAPAAATATPTPAATAEPPADATASGQTTFAIPPGSADAATVTPDSATPQVPDDPRSQALVERVKAMWAAKIKRDFAAVYEFETPDYRARFTAEASARRFGGGVNWRGVEVIDIRHDDEKNATVGILLDYSHLQPFTDGEVRTQSFLREQWTEVSDQWYHQVPLRQPLGDLTPANPEGSTGQSSAPPGEQEQEPAAR